MSVCPSSLLKYITLFESAHLSKRFSHLFSPACLPEVGTGNGLQSASHVVRWPEPVEPDLSGPEVCDHVLEALGRREVSLAHLRAVHDHWYCWRALHSNRNKIIIQYVYQIGIFSTFKR
jgi:hypothetical protein